VKAMIISSSQSLLKSIFFILKIVLPGLEYTISHNHLSNQVSVSKFPSASYILAVLLSSILFNSGSHIFIKNSEENGSVASHIFSHAPKFVIFLKSHLNHKPSVGLILSCIDSYHRVLSLRAESIL
jgi:hypothetical protein